MLSRWLQWTLAVRDLFIADETVLHAIVAYYEVSGLVAVAVDGWNCSPKHKPETLPDDQVRIWHFHGDSNVRPEKSLKGHELWYPAFAECLADNTAEIQDWIDGIDNKHLAKLLRKS